MRAFSREMMIGFLLVIAAMISGCQPVQPVSATAVETGEIHVDSEAITDTAAVDEGIVFVENVSETPVAPPESVTTTVGITDAVDMTMASDVTTDSAADDSAGEQADPALLAAGMAAYRAQYCGVCHTLDAAETLGTFGPEHSDMGSVAAARIADAGYSGKATTPAEYILESIVEPQAYLVPGYATTSHRMPTYAHLDDATLEGLTIFLLSQ